MGLLPSIRRFLSPGFERGAVISIVGAGGKTGALFSIAYGLVSTGLAVAVTTTTHIRDPRVEGFRRFDSVAIDPGLCEPGAVIDSEAIRNLGSFKGITVIASASVPEDSRLRGIHPDKVKALGELFDAVIVEADGSKGLPVKAPAGHEPVIPPCSLVVIGVIGLDCLGKPMDSRVVHRPEVFGPLSGCAAGAPIDQGHLAALVDSDDGLFKAVPAGAKKILVFNKADSLDAATLESFVAFVRGARFKADSILICSRGTEEYGFVREVT